MNKITTTSLRKIYAPEESFSYLLKRRGRLTNPHVLFQSTVKELIMEYVAKLKERLGSDNFSLRGEKGEIVGI